MRVLITGGCGFIGSSLSERLDKEGHEVFIIDNLSTGNQNNVSSNYKFYKIDVASPSCEEIFKSYQFDVVIHLAYQGESENTTIPPQLLANTNVIGLINILDLSKKYKVKRFIYASSASVYGKHEHFPYTEHATVEPYVSDGLMKQTAERYCQQWNSLHGLNTLCLRISHVYGPRQRSGTVISNFLQNLVAGQQLVVYGDGEQTRDFIYVTDVCDAIYRSMFSSYNGVLNLSSNNEYSIKRLLAIINQYTEVNVKYMPSRQEDIRRQCLDNTNIKKIMDWVPLYSLEAGIADTLNWYTQQQEASNEAAASVSTRRGWLPRVLDIQIPSLQGIRKHMPFVENMMMFVAMIMITRLLLNHGFELLVLDLKLVYILLIAIMYGSKQSILAVFLSWFFYLYENINYGYDLVSVLYDLQTLSKLIVYLFVAISIGYFIDKKDRDLYVMNIQLENLEEKHEFLTKVYDDTRKVKEELQHQIINNEDSFGKIYNITKQLESLEPDGIFNAAVLVLEKIMKTDQVSIYTINRGAPYYMRLVAKSSKQNSNLNKSIKISDYPEFQRVIKEKFIYVNKDLAENLPSFAAPVVDAGDTVAVVCIYNVEFEKMTLYYQNLFGVTINLISIALSRSFRHLEGSVQDRFVKETQILQMKYFAEILEHKRKSGHQIEVDYTVLQIVNTKLEVNELSHILTSQLREYDYCGMGEDGTVYIVLSSTTAEEAQFVQKRLLNQSISTVVLDRKDVLKI